MIAPRSPSFPAATAKIAADPLISELEAALAGVHQALLERDTLALELHSGAVQQRMLHLQTLARQGQLNASARQRLGQASALLAAQRVSLSRASSALDRALDTLMPAEPIGLYGQAGKPLKRRSSGDSISA
ncbi:hypothetical protein HNQ51_003277 [Inhella inkyongensis]|uniref:Flagellar protein FlgN n=1 Tax=Inhella inkyongensis TaxID=392593 RepID=A0A840SAA8_9BURK|nr:hypothetical protein [Inhella inkyongensis]MBB5205946.1 hypothetical protein [Inhella inkyongensis]